MTTQSTDDRPPGGRAGTPVSERFDAAPGGRRGTPLAEVVAASDTIRSTRSRRQKVRLLADVLGLLTEDEVAIAVTFLGGAPRQHRLGLGPAAVGHRAVPPATTPRLTLDEVDAALQAIEDTPMGSGSRRARLAAFDGLLARATLQEQDWLIRLVLRELRQGALDGLLVPALAAASGSPEDAIRRGALVTGDLATTTHHALFGGADALAALRLRPGVHLEPMLAASAARLSEAVPGDREVVVEAKLDGARLQVHRDGGQVWLFTRSGQDVTDRLPEVVEAVHALAVDRVVLDTEVLAFDADGLPRAFQATIQRIGRDHDVGRLRAEVPVELRAFDVLHLDGVDLLDEPLATRREALARVIPGHLRAASVTTSDPEVARAFTEEVLAAGHEGVIVKDMDAPYAAGRRGASWRKIKPVHTLDVVVLAAEWGSGRRRGWLSNLHLGARADDGDGFVLLGKTFKGLTDEVLAWQTEALLARETARESHIVHVRPELVVEIALDGVVRSSRYPGGVSLRFARVRGYRPDKAPSDADTLAAVRAIGTGRQPKRPVM